MMKENVTTPVETVALLERVRQGDGAAFDELVALYAPMLNAAVARSVASTPSLDETELASEAKVAFLRAAMEYMPQGSAVTFGRYACICVRNALVSFFRAHRPDVTVASLEDLAEELTSKEGDPSVALINAEEEQQVLQRVRQALSPYENQVFDLYRLGYRASEIARHLKTPERSVNNAIFRMRQKLRREFC